MLFRWDPKKNDGLIKKGRPSFDDIVQAIANGNILDEIPNPIHKGQKILVVRVKGGVVCAVPFEEREGGKVLWLVTVYPSRKLRKAYERKIN